MFEMKKDTYTKEEVSEVITELYKVIKVTTGSLDLCFDKLIEVGYGDFVTGVCDVSHDSFDVQ